MCDLNQIKSNHDFILASSGYNTEYHNSTKQFHILFQTTDGYELIDMNLDWLMYYNDLHHNMYPVGVHHKFITAMLDNYCLAKPDKTKVNQHILK